MSNRFLTNTKIYNQKEKKNVAKKIEIDNLEMFPELQANKQQTDEVSNVSIDFKHILNMKAVETDDKEVDIILPGWAKLSRNQNMIVYEYRGEKEYSKICVKKEVEVEVEVEDDVNLNETMDQIILEMEDKWNRYEYNYDQIHGIGSYADKFVLPPVYGEEYKTDTDTEEESSDYIYSDDDNMYNEFDNFD